MGIVNHNYKCMFYVYRLPYPQPNFCLVQIDILLPVHGFTPWAVTSWVRPGLVPAWPGGSRPPHSSRAPYRKHPRLDRAQEVREDRNFTLSKCIKAEGWLRDGAAMFGLLSYSRPTNGLFDTHRGVFTRSIIFWCCYFSVPLWRLPLIIG